ncbi:MAG: outer membrane lipoprotein-sorting protein [Spirochaetaceae bacterium]|jgi:outer membrane lipoprotein-sorting protein|nr:outer membrane lipoprotein-sorting protein [Spirochaetaceae bacterium]
MKKTIVFVLSLVLIPQLQAQDAAPIVKASRERIDAATVSTRSRMVITAKNGSTTERVIDQYSKDDAQGSSRAVIVFKSPASVAGTRFLTLENPGGSASQWIFLPALAKVRRIASSEGGASFMGTDMSYDDLNATSRNVDDDVHELLREEQYNGKACYVIQSTPKDSSYQYGKMILWIDKTTRVNYKIEMYDRRGALVKTMESSGFKDVQGFLTPEQIKVSTLAAQTSTTIYTDLVKYNDAIPESVFTTRFLETGRP